MHQISNLTSTGSSPVWVTKSKNENEKGIRYFLQITSLVLGLSAPDYNTVRNEKHEESVP
jgi:hypothetical protein